MKKLLVHVLVPLSVMLLNGCLGAVQIEDYGYVQSFGVDKGENKKYAYSFLLQNYQGSGQDGSSQSDRQGIVIGGEGDTMFEALALITAGLPYELNFSRTASVIFSEELAREGEIKQLFSIAQAEVKMRSSVKLMIVHGNTREFQEGLQVENSPDILQMQKSILYSFSQEGTVPMTNYAIFYEAVKTGRFDPIVVYGGVGQKDGKAGDKEEEKSSGGEGGNEKEKTQEQTDGAQKESSIHGTKRFGGMTAYADGTALFNGMNMVGVLNGEETKYLLMARGEMGTSFIHYVYDGDGMLVLHLSQHQKPKVELELQGAPKAKVKLSLVCEIYSDDKKKAASHWERGLREEIENSAQNAIKGVFELCRELDCDALGLGKEATKKFSSMREWENYDWKEHYKQTDAEFEVSIRLRNSYLRFDIE